MVSKFIGEEFSVEIEETGVIFEKKKHEHHWWDFFSGKYLETFHNLRMEIEIQKIGFLSDL